MMFRYQSLYYSISEKLLNLGEAKKGAFLKEPFETAAGTRRTFKSEVKNKMRIKRISTTLLVAILFLCALTGGNRSYSYVQAAFAADKDASQSAEDMLKNMTLEEKIGQMFMLDFRKKDGRDVTSVDEGIANTIKKYKPGGVILFRENTVGTQQTLKLTRDYQKASPKIPLFIAVDQEGGAVARLQSGTVMPGNMALGAAVSRELTYAAAKATGSELKALGINMDFAPVVDVNNNPSNPVIGIRSFGDNPEEVAEMGIEFMKGLNDAGVIAVAKHFPGHGDTAMDSHIALPTVPHKMDRLEKIELVPFQAMIKNGIDMIMTAHVTFPAIDDSEGVPATLSNKCLTGLLRNRMGFEGVIITDAFSMKAITDRYGDKEAAAMAIKAGADIVLMPQDLENAFAYIMDQVKSREIPLERINSSVKRILALKIKRGTIASDSKDNLDLERQALKTVGGEENAFIKRTAAERAVTLVKNEGGQLPFRLADNCSIVFFAPSQTGVDRVKEALNGLTGSAGVKEVAVQGFNYDGQRLLTDEQSKAIEKSDFVLLFTRTVKAADFSPDSSFMPDFAVAVVKNSAILGKKLAAVAVRNPYDIRFLSDVKSYVAVYTDWGGGGVEAAVKAVFGKINPVGKLPVSIPDGAGKIIYRNGYGISYDIENIAAADKSEGYYPFLSELWEKGLLDDAGSFKHDSPLEGQELADLLKKIILVTKGRSFSAEPEQGTLNRYRMMRLFAKATGDVGLSPQASIFDDGNYKTADEYRADVKKVFNLGIITGYPDESLREDKAATRAEMTCAAARFLRLIEKGSILPADFVYLDENIPGAIYDVRYYSNNNFIGDRVDGYMVPRVILTAEAAKALAGAAEELRSKELVFKIFDGYRPQQAVNNFIRWAADLKDIKMKAQFYPGVDKKDLFRLGYIAERSGHSRGSTVDLTLAYAKTGKELDMGSSFDFFGEISHHSSDQVSMVQLKNRMILRNIMEKHGFKPYPEEWWHYTLINEPFSETYFDFPVR